MTPPKGHKWLVCICPICTEIRKFKSARKRRPSMLKHLYEAHRNGHLSIFGTTLAGLSAFWEFVLIKILGNKKLRFWGLHNIKHNPFPHPYNIPIKDGYALVLLSWAFVIWWVLVTVFLFVFYFCLGFACAVYALLWFVCFCGISVFYIPALIYSLICELPASIVNNDLGKIDERKRRNDRISRFEYFDTIMGWVVGISATIGFAFLINTELKDWFFSIICGGFIGLVLGIVSYCLLPPSIEY